MKITGKLEFVDIGTGAWYLLDDETKHRLWVKPGVLDKHLYDSEVTLEVKTMDDPDADTAMLSDGGYQVVSVVLEESDADSE